MHMEHSYVHGLGRFGVTLNSRAKMLLPERSVIASKRKGDAHITR